MPQQDTRFQQPGQQHRPQQQQPSSLQSQVEELENTVHSAPKEVKEVFTAQQYVESILLVLLDNFREYTPHTISAVATNQALDKKLTVVPENMRKEVKELLLDRLQRLRHFSESVYNEAFMRTVSW